MTQYAVVDGCVAPAKLAPILTEIQKETGCTYASIYRGSDAATELHKLGKHTQAEIYQEWLNGTEPNPANPPGRSTHECRSDGVPYPGPVGRHLAWWQCGIDVDDAHVPAFISACAKHGWVAFRPYSSGSEFHHVNLKALPVFFSPDYKLGAKGPMVLLFTGRLVKLGYLDRRWWRFNKTVVAAVRKFQRDHHFTPDGVVGPVTWTAIKKLAASVRRTKPKPVPKPKPRRPKATRISEQAVNAIAGFEGGQSADGLFRPYQDSVGVWTIGYGHTEGVSASSKALTRNQALALLNADLDRTYVPDVLSAGRAYKWLPLTQNELDALASFCFNLGPGYFTPAHSLGAALQKHDLPAAAAAILLYDKAGGQTLPGLTRRRRWEHDLFLKGGN